MLKILQSFLINFSVKPKSLTKSASSGSPPPGPLSHCLSLKLSFFLSSHHTAFVPATPSTGQTSLMHSFPSMFPWLATAHPLDLSSSGKLTWFFRTCQVLYVPFLKAPSQYDIHFSVWFLVTACVLDCSLHKDSEYLCTALYPSTWKRDYNICAQQIFGGWKNHLETADFTTNGPKSRRIWLVYSFPC